MPNKNNAIIVLDQVSKSYEIKSKKIVALENINLKIREGEFIVINGPSGAGKTTLLYIIAGLEKPDSGDVIVLEKVFSTLDDDRMVLYRALNIGFVFQSYNLISTFTARENIELPLFLLDFKKERVSKRAQKMLNLVDLAERADHLPSQLSSGEQQRISFARALVNDPPIIIADEPTANLDKETAKKIIELFNLLKLKKKTIIVATHNQQILQMADNIINLYNGEMVDELPTHNLRDLFDSK